MQSFCIHCEEAFDCEMLSTYGTLGRIGQERPITMCAHPRSAILPFLFLVLPFGAFLGVKFKPSSRLKPCQVSEREIARIELEGKSLDTKT